MRTIGNEQSSRFERAKLIVLAGFTGSSEC